MMNENEDMFADSLVRILADHADGMHAAPWAASLWATLDGAGFPRALAAQSAGGSALGWADAFSLFAAAGQAAAPVPLAESMVAHWLLGTADIASAATLLSLSAPRQPLDLSARAAGGWALSGTLPRVPWGRLVDGVVTIALHEGKPMAVLIACKGEGVSIKEGQDMAAEPRDDLVLHGAPAQACGASPVSPMDLMAIAAAARAAQMAGALRAVLTGSVEYANLRKQFGRSLSAFQAIQHKLAAMATQTAAALAAAQAGMEAIDACLTAPQADRMADSIELATAKIRAGEAAGLCATGAHQVFGAIGFTVEHSLHQHTKRLWSWRDEFGNEAFWSRRLGESIIASGPGQLWPRVTARAGHAPLREVAG